MTSFHRLPWSASAVVCVGISVLLAGGVRQSWSQQSPAPSAPPSRSYVGSAKCGECHEAEYARFTKFSKMAQAFKGVEKMKDVLTPDEVRGCFQCHTTGYGEPGGFRSEEATPGLRNASCEACHGPGSDHVGSGDASLILGKGQVSLDRCARCHTEERVAAFKFKPLLYCSSH